MFTFKGQVEKSHCVLDDNASFFFLWNFLQILLFVIFHFYAKTWAIMVFRGFIFYIIIELL